MNKDEVQSLMGRGHPLAGALCLLGFFLHILLSDPLLDALGFHYSGTGGAFYEKIHPGTIFIFASFLVLLVSMGNPITALLRIFRNYPAFLLLLALYILIFLYLLLRSGPEGMAFIIDTHITAPLCAIVLCYTPLAMCRRAAGLFVALAALNSVIGLAEGYTKTRLFHFNPDWQVLREEYFRASALRGHPLVNAAFTVIALFVAMSLRLRSVIKAVLILLFTASLVAFGSRAAMLIAIMGLLALGVSALGIAFGRPLSMQGFFGLLALAIVIPFGFIGFLAFLLHSGLGERLMAAARWDESANSRLLAFQAFRHMTGEEILFGLPMAKLLAITDRMNMDVRLGGIENPWLMMLMYLGLVWFLLWLAATIVFILRLMRRQPLALKLAVLSYFAIASTFNSFGTKDSTYLIMVCAVVCAGAPQLSALRRS